MTNTSAAVALLEIDRSIVICNYSENTTPTFYFFNFIIEKHSCKLNERLKAAEKTAQKCFVAAPGFIDCQVHNTILS